MKIKADVDAVARRCKARVKVHFNRDSTFQKQVLWLHKKKQVQRFQQIIRQVVRIATGVLLFYLGGPPMRSDLD